MKHGADLNHNDTCRLLPRSEAWERNQGQRCRVAGSLAGLSVHKRKVWIGVAAPNPDKGHTI